MKNKNLKLIVENEALKIVQEILGFGNDAANSELEFQRKTARDINSRGVNAPAKKQKDSEDKNKINQQKKQDEADEETLDNKKSKAPPKENEKEKDEASSEEKDKSGGKGTKDSPKLMPSVSSLMNPNFEDILDGISLIRGGKSAKKNPQIRKALRSYFDDLSSAERRTLNAFLLGSAQVLSDYDTDDAVEPDDVGVEIKSTKEPGDLKRNQPNQRLANTSVSVSKKSSDSPVIVVGERANKDKEMMLLASYRRN
jgi:hypothetical protein